MLKVYASIHLSTKIFLKAITKERKTSATGTSTDGVVLTIDTNGDVLTDAGSFSLFGDTLAKAVYVGIQRALENAIGAE